MDFLVTPPLVLPGYIWLSKSRIGTKNTSSVSTSTAATKSKSVNEYGSLPELQAHFDKFIFL